MADPEPPAGGLDAFERFPLLHGGLIDLVGKGEIAPDSNVLYVHLGGAPALNGYSALFT